MFKLRAMAMATLIAMFAVGCAPVNENDSTLAYELGLVALQVGVIRAIESTDNPRETALRVVEVTGAMSVTSTAPTLLATELREALGYATLPLSSQIAIDALANNISRHIYEQGTAAVPERAKEAVVLINEAAARFLQ